MYIHVYVYLSDRYVSGYMKLVFGYRENTTLVCMSHYNLYSSAKNYTHVPVFICLGTWLSELGRDKSGCEASQKRMILRGRLGLVLGQEALVDSPGVPSCGTNHRTAPTL